MCATVWDVWFRRSNNERARKLLEWNDTRCERYIQLLSVGNLNLGDGRHPTDAPRQSSYPFGRARKDRSASPVGVSAYFPHTAQSQAQRKAYRLYELHCFRRRTEGTVYQRHSVISEPCLVRSSNPSQMSWVSRHLSSIWPKRLAHRNNQDRDAA